MKKIVKNTLINILLLSPLLFIIVRYWEHEYFRTIVSVLFGGTILISLAFAVFFGIVRVVLSAREVWNKWSEMYTVWRRAKVSVKNDDRLEKCTKCKGLGYTYWINNINGKSL